MPCGVTVQAEWLCDEQKFFTKPEVVAACREAIMGTSIYRHASDYMWVINYDVEVRAINELNKFIFQLKKNHP